MTKPKQPKRKRIEAVRADWPSGEQVVRLMLEGWELGASNGLHNSYWIQRDGLGCGGQSLSVRRVTVHALLKTGQIRIGGRKSDPFYLTRYVLTKAARAKR